jgi:hypothetical protein
MGFTAVAKKPKRNDVTVKIDAAIVAQAKHIATSRDITLAEYLTEVLRAPVGRDFERFKRQLNSGEYNRPQEE